MALPVPARVRLLLLGACAAAATAACGTPVAIPTPTPVPTPAPTPDVIALGQKYISAMVPIDKALSQFEDFGRQAAAATPSQAQVTAAAQPLISALEQGDAILTSTVWPASLSGDMLALDVELHRLVADLKAATPASVQSTLPSDLHELLRVKSKVSLDFGMPGL